MTKIASIVFGALLIAGPATVSAQTRGADGSSRPTTEDTRRLNAYDQYPRPFEEANKPSPPLTAEEERNKEDFGFSGRDPSRIGGEDPNLNPGD
jgi:hypothetical protein